MKSWFIIPLLLSFIPVAFAQEGSDANIPAVDEPVDPQGIIQLKSSDLLDKMDFKPIDVPANLTGEVAAEELKEQVPPLVEYVIDSSGSMGQILTGKKTKIYVLKKILNKYLMAQWTEKAASGLRVFGGRRKKDCKDNFLAIPPKSGNLGAIEGVVKGFEPVGMTPLAFALRDATKDLKDYNGPKRIVLFTDGEETCGQDPCKTVEQLKASTVDIKFFVVAFGLRDQLDTLKKLACIGDMNQADNEEQLDELFQDLDKKLNPNKNLFVESPEPKATVFLFKASSPDIIYRKFPANLGIEVPPGDYVAIVNLKPKYKFQKFTIPAKKKITLRVKGDGYFQANFMQKLMKIELLDKNKKAVRKFTSDVRVALPQGRWSLRFYREPFFEKVIDNYLIIPNAEYVYNIEEAGAAIVDDPKVRGVYVYDGKVALLGNHLTNFPVVLGKGVYEIRVDKSCVFKDVIMGSNKDLVRLSCDKVKK
ncbi:vWA domain-containing protein [Bdellovibrio reynosensis]|uniref:VWA domain-containing protein n=1 Tax=Bdellovibrio reynosensis TaxID=2835041 RepID=A0ABY4C8G5_9BACT|nr:VWA domain-containing protein [Bdellovibrio reynosensis]UOF00182.1 VWA domain-containing protein [Bdellovibrio reynosensis]